MLGETILVIDTDAETTQQIVSILESEDYLVFTASSGDVGVTMAKKVNPSAIFVNPAMSGTSGLEICKTIHSIELLKDVPIIVLSAFEGTMDPRYAALYGIVDSLKKPFTSQELISKTKNALTTKPFDVQRGIESQQPVVEDIESGESEELIAVEKDMSEIQKDEQVSERIDVYDKTMVKPREDIDSFDKTVVKQQKEEMEEEKTEHIQIPREKPEEITEDSTVIVSKESKEPDRTYVLKKNIRRRGRRNRLFMPIIIAVVIIILGGGGFILYKKGLLPWIGQRVQKQVTVKPAQPVEQQAVKVPPSQEQQKPQEAPVEKKPVTAPTLPPATPSAKATPKPAGTTIYSVQIGAFKNEDNAKALIKQYKEKGYEAFTYKSTLKNKEILHRVLIGKFDNKKDVLRLAEDIRTKEKVETIIFKE